MIEDHRKAPRRRTFYRATISFGSRAASLGCTVRDVSVGGMRLELREDTLLPETFELTVPQLDISFRTVRIIWMRDHDIGVHFETAAAPDAVNADLAERVAQLEHEVARLSRQLSELRLNIKRYRNED